MASARLWFFYDSDDYCKNVWIKFEALVVNAKTMQY